MKRCLLVAGVAMAVSLPLMAKGPTTPELEVDFRYAPLWWQTAICLPDDWQKTLVAKDGALLYDYPGPHADFKTKITAGLGPDTQWVSQQLASPRVAIVRTVKRAGPIELLEEAFALPPEPEPGDSVTKKPLLIESRAAITGVTNWANPTVDCDPAFRHAAAIRGTPIRYGFAAGREKSYDVALGFCEGTHSAPGKRVVDVQVEGAASRTIDLPAAFGRNVPRVVILTARDVDGDGQIEIAISPAAGAEDPTPVLNVLWVYPGGQAPPAEELIAGKPGVEPLAKLDCGGEPQLREPTRQDVMTLILHNTGNERAQVEPIVTIETVYDVIAQAGTPRGAVGHTIEFVTSEPIRNVERAEGQASLHFDPIALDPGERRTLSLGVVRGRSPNLTPERLAAAPTLRAAAEAYWRSRDFPYDRITVPDAGVQSLIDSAIRNIYQAREIKRGLPAFQVGPTCYRGLWVVDGSFLLEAMTFLGRADETRAGIGYLLGMQRDDGAIMLIDGHWKETGIAIWAAYRHARLTDDKAWLRSVWPKLERAFAYIQSMRKAASADPNAPNAGLVPAGFSDGGLTGTYPEYTNVYWTMVGLRAAVDAARWLGRDEQADDWQREYEDFRATFRRAAERDMKTAPEGYKYLPIRMRDDEGVAPQRAQWAFLHAVFPGKLFEPDDPLVTGNLAMLRSVEGEGLVVDTGWCHGGIWNYFGSFYAHAWLWTGDGAKAAETLYAFANHAAPLLVWREEQRLRAEHRADGYIGDMPHNWASAEFIRLTRHLIVLERGHELHLFEGLPAKWARPGAVTRLDGVVTVFGPLSLEFRVSDDGRTATLRLSPPTRTPPQRIVLHLDHWSGRTGTVDLPTTGSVERTIDLGTRQD